MAMRGEGRMVQGPMIGAMETWATATGLAMETWATVTAWVATAEKCQVPEVRMAPAVIRPRVDRAVMEEATAPAD